MRIIENDIIPFGTFEAMGQILARSDRAGLSKNQIKTLNGKGYDKVLRGSATPVMKYAKKNGVTVGKEELAGLIQGAKDSALSQSKYIASSGGKRPSLNTIY